MRPPQNRVPCAAPLPLGRGPQDCPAGTVLADDITSLGICGEEKCPLTTQVY
ncbi:hypothetical protein ACIQZB_40575 [Streptomyces sp. NPDC097727]|uniref:hypothetical protein n=1 Tax=Streptomyces sp. NPDC097727 TaxID=3366092 RepID=UPI00380BD8CE